MQASSTRTTDQIEKRYTYLRKAALAAESAGMLDNAIENAEKALDTIKKTGFASKRRLRSIGRLIIRLHESASPNFYHTSRALSVATECFRTGTEIQESDIELINKLRRELVKPQISITAQPTPEVADTGSIDID